jgi:glycosyltransferase involved in cell wall biosynthesis
MGGNAAQFSALKCLESDHQFVLVCPISDEGGKAASRELQARLPLVRVRTVFCGTEQAPFNRFLTRVRRRIALEVSRLLPSSSRKKSAEARPVYHFGAVPEKVIEALEEEISKGVDLCQAEFAEMLSLGSWFPKHVPKLFIHHQVHAVYSRRFIEVNGSDAYTDYLDAWWNVHERANLEQFDGVLTFSEQDSKVLSTWIPQNRLFVSPFPVPADIGITEEAPDRFDGRFVFLASGEHPPNRDALDWLVSDIWPHVLEQLPTSTLVVIGKWSRHDRARLTAPGVVFTGFVESLTEHLPGAIMLVPLRIGSGIRVKILAGMAQGVPVISTSVGAEGLSVADNEEILIRDGDREFAEAAVALAQNHQLWKRLAIAGRATVIEHYSPQSVRRERNSIYARLSASRANQDETTTGQLVDSAVGLTREAC